jgi:hypothetical protein
MVDSIEIVIPGGDDIWLVFYLFALLVEWANLE